MVFLSGDHHLNNSFEIASIRELRMVSHGSIADPSKIICHGSAWKIVDISHVYLRDMIVISCAFSIANIEAFNMVNVIIRDSDRSGLHALNSRIVLQNSMFVRNGRSRYVYDGAIVAPSSSISMKRDTDFLNNSATWGGAIHATSSNISLEGSVNFINNRAKWGGAIFATSSTITMEGDVNFLDNSATWGGAIYVTSSNIIMEGNVSLLNNSATWGGVIIATSSNIRLEGDVSLLNNSATWGGVITATSSNISLEGDVSLLNNSATWGGAIYVTSSNIIMERDVNFLDNSATWGGAILATSSNISMIGNIRLLNNSARYGGAIKADSSNISMIGVISLLNNSGAIQADSSNISMIGVISLLNNSAGYGGAIQATSSNISMIGVISLLNNNAGYGGAIRATSSNISMIGDVSLLNNSAGYGGAIQATSSNISMIGDVNFLHNIATKYNGGAILALDVSIIIDGNTTFLGNSAPFGEGGAINLVRSSYTHLESACLMFHNNQAVKGGAIFASGSTYYLRGYSNFTGNHADTLGGAISAQTSNVHVEGTVIFLDNNAQLGGAMYLEYVSHIHLSSKTDLNFVHNKAERGGAIYIRDSTYFVSCAHSDISSALLRYSCPFISTIYHLSVTFNRFSVTFNGNNASEKGDAIFGGFSKSCAYWLRGTILDNPLLVSSEPSTVNLCNGQPELTVSRGATFSIPVIALDQIGSAVPATIRAYFTFSDGSSSDLAEGQSLQKIGAECTTLNYTVFSTLETVDLYIYAEEGPCGPTESMRITIHLQDCPHIFVLNNLHCVCEQRLQKFTNSCNIDNRTFKRTWDSNFWVGIEQQNGTYSGLILHPHCPLDYCRNDQIDVSTEDLDSQCQFNRTGILCGACGSNYSLALGGSQCLECTDSHLGLIIVFAVAGITLVLIISLLRLTVSIGTLSGLIFYANIVAINRAIFIPQGTTNILTIFIAWLNLDLGIVTCFYDGMDTYTLTWLQYVFPGYIWFLAMAIVLISQRSVRISRMLGNNPVSVLTTLFLLSYANILRTIITSLSATTLEYPGDNTRVVWLYDGHVDYLKSKHIPLFIFSLIVLIFLFLPYTLFLFFSQWLQVLSNRKILFWMNSARIKIFLDTYHAPHNVKHRYWPGLLLLIRCILFVAFTSNPTGDPSINLLCITSVSLGLAVLTRSINIYSNWSLDILENSFILNLGILAGVTYHVRSSGGNQEVVTYLSIGIAFTEFVGIVIYHTIIQLKNTAIVKCFQNVMSKMIKTMRHGEIEKKEVKKDEVKADTEMEDVNDFGIYAHYRESVLYIADD